LGKHGKIQQKIMLYSTDTWMNCISELSFIKNFSPH